MPLLLAGMTPRSALTSTSFAAVSGLQRFACAIYCTSSTLDRHATSKCRQIDAAIFGSTGHGYIVEPHLDEENLDELLKVPSRVERCVQLASELIQLGIRQLVHTRLLPRTDVSSPRANRGDQVPQFSAILQVRYAA
jgi:hypothetical protein